MDSNQRRGGFHISHDKSDRLLDAMIAVMSSISAEAVYPELSPSRGEIGRSNLLQLLWGHSFYYSEEIPQAKRRRVVD